MQVVNSQLEIFANVPFLTECFVKWAPRLPAGKSDGMLDKMQTFTPIPPHRPRNKYLWLACWKSTF